MTEESSQAGVDWEELLERVSQWVTTPPVIQLLTGLSFAASPALLCLVMPPDFFRFILSWPWYLVPPVCLILGCGLGFPLGRTMTRIREKGRYKKDTRVVVRVGLAWLVVGAVQVYLYQLFNI